MSKVVLITGASSGIGKALAIEAGRKGYSVCMMARTESSLLEVQQLLQKVPTFIFAGNVKNEVDCQQFIALSAKKFGKIDILINNAGISMRALFKDADLQVLKELMDVNFWGSVYCTKYALPYLLETKGSVVGVSSIAGFKGLPARTGYSASKFALQGFLESLRIENLKTGLHVLVACPGYTESNIRKSALNETGKAQGETPLNEGKLMSSEEVAKHLWKAIDQRKKYLILTLQGKMAVFLNKISSRLTDILTYNVIKKEPNSPFQ